MGKEKGKLKWSESTKTLKSKSKFGFEIYFQSRPFFSFLSPPSYQLRAFTASMRALI